MVHDRSSHFTQQTKLKQELLQWYGDKIYLLNATYRTPNDVLPLFFLVVSTNLDYMVAPSFILEAEDADSIKEAPVILQ